jgi:multiple sugar transport system substrate-binding protein
MDAAFEDPAFNTGHYKVFKKTLGYATAYPPLGTWGSIENAIVGEFKNILTDYVTGKLKDNGIKQRLDLAAERVDAALRDER